MHAKLVRTRRLPDEVRRLRAPWPSLAREVPHLTAELERDFRFGQRVTMTERGFLVGGTIKGGSSSMWVPGTADQFEAFLRWKAIDGFLDDGDPADFEELRSFLASMDVELVCGRGPASGDGDRHAFRRELGAVYPLVLSILRELPERHLASPSLRRIQVGGWGPDAAKGSAYENGTVYLYDFAVRGARRTLIGILLHELGHAHAHALGDGPRADLGACYAVLLRSGAFFGVEYVLDAASRRAYQRTAFEEFLAETYLAYTACGGALHSYMTALHGDARAAWTSTYELFKESFEGYEYE